MVSQPQGKPWTREASPPLPPHGAGYLTLRSLHLLGNGPIVIVPLPSFRWGMNGLDYGVAYNFGYEFFMPRCTHRFGITSQLLSTVGTISPLVSNASMR